MRIFISYASERRSTAERIRVGLAQEGHEVFLDKLETPAGTPYDAPLRKAVEGADAFLFLISPESVAHGAYALTEAGFAEQRWKDPAHRVLPVMVADTPLDDVPGYLRAVGILFPEGDLVAEVLARVAAMAARHARGRRLKVAGALAVVACLAGAALAGGGWRPWVRREVLVTGRLVDRVSGAGVAGASLEVRRGNDVLARAFSGDDGRFRLPFTARAGKAAPDLTLDVEHADYVPDSRPVAVAAGGAASPPYDLALLPRRLRECRATGGRGVVVGAFSPPIGAAAGYEDLSGRMATALSHDVNIRLQQKHLPLAAQPDFRACTEARLRSWQEAEGVARALDADAFVSGSVKKVDALFDVETEVVDRYGLFRPSFQQTSKAVDLAAPAAAQLDPHTHAAVLLAVARGCEESRRYADCVDVAVAARRLLNGSGGEMAGTIDEVKARCQRATGSPELAGGAP